MNVTGKLLSGIGDEWPEKPGEFCFLDSQVKKEACLAFMCPCGCGREGALPIRPSEEKSDSWEWDGNREQPTLQPSIWRNKNKYPEACGWHGHLVKGIWISC